MGCITSKKQVQKSTKNETESLLIHTDQDLQTIKMKRCIKSLEEKIEILNFQIKKLLIECKQLILNGKTAEAKTILQLNQIYQQLQQSFVNQKQQVINLLNQSKLTNIAKLTTQQMNFVNQLLNPKMLEQQNLKLKELISLSQQTDLKQEQINQLYLEINLCDIDDEMDTMKREMGFNDKNLTLNEQVPIVIQQDYIEQIQI